MATATSIDQLCINTIRVLSADAVQKANSGHPGLPMGAAALAYALWQNHLRHNPKDPNWQGRDRFVLSAGHGSMLLYSLLYLTGYDLSLDDIKQFRQWHSKTPGHPEYGDTPGVEVTTGPLGQGFANGVGMAMAAKHLAAVYNRPGHAIVDDYIYGIVSDGDLMEGISHEAASLAGHLGLGNLIYLFDDNHVTLDAPADWSVNDDQPKRFEAYNWHVQCVDGMDADAVDAAIRAAQAVKDKPSLIACRTIIGYGAPHVQGTSEAHGKALGEDELRLAKQFFGFNPDEHFAVPAEALAHMRRAVDRGAQLEAEWNERFAAYEKAFPELAAQFKRVMAGGLPRGWDADVPLFTPADGAMATRSAQGKVLNALAPKLPELFGGSADLSGSTDTDMKGMGVFQKSSLDGRNIYFGVREHAMGAALNGMTLHGGVRPFGATFLAFYDYMRPPVRLAALMGIPATFVYTHDSIGLGEDGPTHQPVEQLAGLRSVPNLVMLRPGDANETAEAWKVALQHKDGPCAIVLSRQKLPIIDQAQYGKASGVARGAYVLAEADGGPPQVILIATGSEVQLVVEARAKLAAEGIRARAVSMPSWALFERQPQSYRDEVLPPPVTARVSIEAGSPQGWRRWVGDRGIVIGLDHFGASAPGEIVMAQFGFTADHVVAAAKSLVRAP
ncbi:MAG TPA: transketolase [Dehalococcoidia bacterium]|nr:transketolase [Dehalococcoidia bacterium]